MGKKKRRKQEVNSPQTFSNRPFKGLSITPSQERSTTVQSQREEKEKVMQEDVSDDDKAFAQLADGVSPFDKGVKLAHKTYVEKPLLIEMDDTDLVMRHLDELVHGNAAFDIADTDEYIEASVQGLDKRIVKRLRKGEYAIQGHLDLHGYRRDEARVAVAEFIEKSYASKKRCVLIVHGRGLGSKDNIPILKEKLRAWLTRGAMGRKVLAYTSARPYDGGTGAVYVLLRG